MRERHCSQNYKKAFATRSAIARAPECRVQIGLDIRRTSRSPKFAASASSGASAKWFSLSDWAQASVPCAAGSKRSVALAASPSPYSGLRRAALLRFCRRVDLKSCRHFTGEFISTGLAAAI